jgi:hypothetical protein
MNEKKLNQLFSAAAKELPPSPEAGLENLVLSAIHREQRKGAIGTTSLFDQLGALFPRLVWVAALVMVLCVAADFGLSAAGVPSLTDGVAQISDQWLFTNNGF